ncbi:MAG: murein hydrolase activator EnvC family protein [Rhizobiaceae bacterium]
MPRHPFKSLLVILVVFLPVAIAIPQELESRRDQTRHELNELRAAIELSEQRRNELLGQIKELDKDRTTINRTLIETTKKSRGLEKRIEKSGNRLSQLRDEQSGVRESLSGKQSLLAEVLGALQRMGRKPPPALLVTPDDALSSVRSAILLGSVIPEMRSETEILVGELQELTRISREILEQREGLSTDLVSLAQEEERLNLLLEEKQRLASTATADLAQESAKAAELAAKASSLDDLISNLETQIASVREAAEAAKVAEEERKLRDQERIAAAKKYTTEEVFADPGRIVPALSFDQARTLLPLPVSGELVSSFGEKDGAESTSNGMSFATSKNTRVITPADGWIVYAGTFRSYGQLLIINAGAGYHIVLAGMEKINVTPGQFVIVGEPVGSMGVQRVASIGQVDVSTTKPILYVEFRKDGKSIDPTPWWADTNLERESNDS